MTKVKSKDLSLWFADGTNYAGQDSLRGRKRRFEQGEAGLPASAGRRAHADRVQVFRSRHSIAPTCRTGAHPTPSVPRLGPQAQVLVDLATTRRASTSSRSSPSCWMKATGRFPLQQSQYADDDLIVAAPTRTSCS
jgi:L-rhamnose isomerase/sugar isomerase